jgi:hypothetical protein
MISGNKSNLTAPTTTMKYDFTNRMMSFSVVLEPGLEYQTTKTFDDNQPTKFTSTFSVTNNKTWWANAVCINIYGQQSANNFIDFTSNPNGAQNFTLITVVESTNFTQENNNKLACELRDKFGLRSSVGFNDLLAAEDGSQCSVKPSTRMLRNNFFISRKKEEIIFFFNLLRERPKHIIHQYKP